MKISIDEGNKIGEGTYGKVYPIEGDLVFKRFECEDSFSSLISETSALRTLKGKSAILDINNIRIGKLVGFSMKRYPGTLKIRFPHIKFIQSGDSLNIIFDSDNVVNPELAKCILFQLLLSLYNAHSVGIIHSDIKPDNILINEDNEIALIDWGLSQFLLIKTGYQDFNIQTAGFKAPEIAYGSDSYDCKIDIWSAALIYYFIMNDGVNFNKYSTVIEEDKFYQQNPNFRLKNNVVADDQIEDLLSRMLTNPYDRYSASDCVRHKCFNGFTNCINLSSVNNFVNISAIRSIRSRICKNTNSIVFGINRKNIYEYIIKVTTQLNANKSCVLIAIMINDYIHSLTTNGSRCSIHIDKIVPLALGSILVASEFAELFPIEVGDLDTISSHKYSINLINKIRNTIFKKFKYNLYFLTPIVVINAICDQIYPMDISVNVHKSIIENKNIIINKVIEEIVRFDYYESSEIDVAFRVISSVTGLKIN
jgi:serine/threonine protein kinase